mgnify:CR=1 FL=1
MASATINEEDMINLHTPLVISIAYKFQIKPPLDYDDLISVGKIGLLKAIRSFDPKRGNQFSTLASTIIRREIVRELEKSNNKDHQSLECDIAESPSEGLDDYLPEGLNDIEKRVLTLRLCSGFTFKEIGEELGYTKQWANNKFKEILAKIVESNEQQKEKNFIS